MGQYSTQKDRLKSLFEIDSTYNDIHIDWGELYDYFEISVEEYESIDSDSISQQSSLRSIKSFPLAKDSSFDGYTITFDEVKVENVQIQRSTHHETQNNAGDIQFELFGKISKIESYIDYEIIEHPEIVVPETLRIRETSSWFTNYDFSLDGCFTAIGSIFMLLPIIWLVIFFISLGWVPIVLFLSIVLLIWLLNKFSSKTKIAKRNNFGRISGVISSFFTMGFSLLIGWALLGGLMRTCGNDQGRSSYQPPMPIEDETEGISQEKIINLIEESDRENDQVNSDEITPLVDTLIISNRVWKDYRGGIHKLNLTVSKREMRTSTQLRDQISFSNGFEDIYRNLSVDNDHFLRLVYKNLDSLRERKQLNPSEFAETVVSMVQDIPYKLILESDCEPLNARSRFVQDYLRSCPDVCCMGNIKFGLQTPTEFMGNLFGDCDTRTVFLFTVLNHFGYDVGIMNSDQFSHSMLAINLPYMGRYKLYNNKQYYVWETTSVNLIPGFMPPEYDNINLWDMILTSK